MKKILLLILITSFCFSCAVQKPRGLYYDEKSGCMACVHNDSIAIVYKRSEWDGPCYFYGTFNRTQDTIVLNENLLRHKNSIIWTISRYSFGSTNRSFRHVLSIDKGLPSLVDLSIRQQREFILEQPTWYKNYWRNNTNSYRSGIRLISNRQRIIG